MQKSHESEQTEKNMNKYVVCKYICVKIPDNNLFQSDTNFRLNSV